MIYTRSEQEIEDYRDKHKEPSPIVKAILEDCITALADTGVTGIDCTLEDILNLSAHAVESLPIGIWGTSALVNAWINR